MMALQVPSDLCGVRFIELGLVRSIDIVALSFGVFGYATAGGALELLLVRGFLDLRGCRKDGFSQPLE
ncbi:MAG: hypothetical protein IT365_24410 [Candidatus Hydrogenedentes bacterium]|nr:hypothetical protein [Candidatus Hydrogenedentota bacterium]